MPYSSRRKQSKPQHLLNEGVEEQDMPTAGSQKVTSSHDTTAGEPVTQEGHYGSMLTDGETRKNGAHNEVGHFSNFKQNSESDNGFDTSDSDGEETEIIVRDIANHYPEQNDTDSMPHDLSLKNKVADSEIENDFDLEDEGQEGDGMLPVFTSPSELLTDRFCVYCNVVKKSPADLERHLRKHTGDRPFQCQECTKSFKSKRSLQYHQYMSHGTEPDDSNIAQRYQLLRKRRLEEQNKLDHSQSNPSGTFEPITSSSSTYLSGSPANLNTSPSSHIDTSASKRQKVDELTSPHSQYIGAITPTSSSDLTFDLQIARSIEKGMKSLSSDGGDGQDLTRACPVCAKAFPKPSDLKRHMMCHTGEKPFRCQYCNKPFRAKSSMHYHLKATHGVEIELSPGLEERYMRMKTRAQMNFIQRGHLTGVTYPFNSEASELPQYQRDNIDIDEIEEDTKSTDSSYFHNSGIGSEFSDAKSQGHYSNTGIYEKTAVDLSISGNGCGKLVGEAVITGEAPFQKNKISIQNETVLITRLDGLDLLNGECSSIYKCYLCGKMFSTLSKMQCHLSLHFEKQMVKFECCFCDELFQFKTQMKNHIRRKHNGQFNGKFDVTNQDKLNEGKNSFSSNSNGLPEKASLLSKSADNQFSCRYCRKTFSKKISLHKHMRLHFWNKNCFCRICGKSFNQYTSLQLHISRFHWKSAGKTSWLRQKYNFFNSNRFKQNSHDGIPKQDSSFPLNLIKPKIYQNAVQASLPHSDVTVVMPQSPPLDNGDISDAATSHHSSENNWSESLSDNTVLEIEDGGIEIRTAPKRLLLPVRRGENSPKSKSSRKSTPTHLQTQNLPTSDNNVPLNFIKTEALNQDNNNNEPPHESNGHLSPEGQSQVPNLESIAPGYSMNATSQLLMAKALAAHKAHQSLNQQLNHTSQPMIFPPNHLPPNLAAMTGMMTLPVSIQVPVTETRTGTSKSPSPASHTSSKSDTSPDDRDGKEISRDSLLGYPRVQWGQNRTGPDWTFNMYCPTESNHTDGRKVTSLSRTHSRLGIVHSPINREAMCKPTQMPDGRTVYKCPFCSKEFLSFSDINRHMDFHEDDKRRESTLLSAPKNRNKLSSDLDIRPYKCQYCDYFARTNSQLKVHMMRHQGIREFCCKLCNYKGVTQSDLNRHMKSQIHMLKSRNACKYCGEGFVTGKNLEKHLDGNCIVKMQKLNGGLDLPLQESLA